MVRKSHRCFRKVLGQNPPDNPSPLDYIPSGQNPPREKILQVNFIKPHFAELKNILKSRIDLKLNISNDYENI